MKNSIKLNVAWMRFPSEAFEEIANLNKKGKSKKTARLF